MSRSVYEQRSIKTRIRDRDYVPIKQLDVLVADDHKLTRDMIGQVLSALDCRRVRYVADGADACTLQARFVAISRGTSQ